VYRSWNLKGAWRLSPMALSGLLRSVCEDAFNYHQLASELSPRAGGPPG
jgi:hypothetical protein